MRVFSNKRGMLRVLCVLLMALTIFMPNVVEAASLTVYVNTSKDYSASASGETLYVTLSGASGNAILKYSPSWTTCTKGGNSPTITVEANDSGKDRSGSVVYMDGDNKTYTLNIKQKAQKVTVQFNLNGGSGYEPNYYSREYTVGTKYDSLPVAPTPPTGYRFDDWFSGPYGGYRITADTIVSASYKTLYARYLIRSYTISFNTDGGSYVSPKSVTYKNNYGTLTTPTKEYYSFQGWFTSNGSQVFSDTPMNTAADHTLYARWKRKTVTVKFNDNGGSGGVSERTYDQGAAYGYLPAGPTPPKGYSFKGWYTAAQGGNSVSTGSIVSDSITALYAQYSPNKYIVKLNSNGGTSVTEKQVTFDSTYGTLTSPTRTGYIFKGWYNADGKQVTSGTYVKTAANHTLVAHWTANTYKITFSSQGGSSVAEKNVTYDSTYGTLVTPSKTGYDFQGWYTAPAAEIRLLPQHK